MSEAVYGNLADRSHRTGLLFVFSAGVLWSTIGLCIRLIEDASVWQILFYRSISLTLLLFVVIWLRTQKNPFRLAFEAGIPSVVGALALVIAYTGCIYAIQATSVANALLLFAAAPFFAAVLGWLVLGEPVRRATGIAIVTAICGIAIMVTDQSSTGGLGGALGGNLAALVSALGFAVFTVALRWRQTSEMLPSVFLSGVFAIILMGLICWQLDLTLILSPNDGLISAGMGIFQIGAGLVLFTLGSKTVPAAELVLLSMSEVLLGPLWVWIFLGETASVNTLTGGLVLLCAIAGNAFSSTRRRPPPILGP
jgi:DME family drug/metabolite transporter